MEVRGSDEPVVYPLKACDHAQQLSLSSAGASRDECGGFAKNSGSGISEKSALPKSGTPAKLLDSASKLQERIAEIPARAKTTSRRSWPTKVRLERLPAHQPAEYRPATPRQLARYCVAE